MAFGMEFEATGVALLSLFRIVFVGFITSYILKLIRKNADKILIISSSLILAGAIGNIVDGVFYGVLFSESYHQLASFLPEGGGRLHFFGKVVDMFYFPILKVIYLNGFLFGVETISFFSDLYLILRMQRFLLV